MGIFNRVSQRLWPISITRKTAEKAVEQKIRRTVEKELGNKSLAYMSRIARGTIRITGVDAVRKKVISGIESDLRRAIKKNPSATVDDLIRDAVNTPDYMALLRELGMSEEHLRVMTQDALGGKRTEAARGKPKSRRKK